MEARRQNEALAVRIDDGATGTTNAPTDITDPTDGIQTPDNKMYRMRAILEVIKGAASGTRTFHVKVHGLRTRRYYQDAQYAGAWDSQFPNDEVAGSGSWQEIFDTEEYSNAADFNMSFLLEDACAYERLETEIVANGGTTPTLTTQIAFIPRG
jgi:hypothetical protein